MWRLQVSRTAPGLSGVLFSSALGRQLYGTMGFLGKDEDHQDREYSERRPDITKTIRKRGMEVIQDPIYNKGTAHPENERDRLCLRGLLPPRYATLDLQVANLMREYEKGYAARAATDPDDKIIKSGVNPDNIRKWKMLTDLHDTNEHLYYYLLLKNFVEMAPVIYTPTVGWACANYHKIFRRPRGMYFSALDRGEMAWMVYNWPYEEVDAIVVTDGSRILGLGDLGACGMGISVGKLDVYVAAAGFEPDRVLPILIDVGTNNTTLRRDPHYIGINQPRLTGDEYYSLLDEFMVAVYNRWPSALVQFEDFETSKAFPLLERYREDYLVFNDDIQGTAGTALAGVYGALRVQGMPLEDITKLKIVMAGAGSAGMGVASQLKRAMEEHGLSPVESASNFHVCDHNGLITEARQDLDQTVSQFARKETSLEGMSLADVVEHAKPNVLIGLSTVKDLFTKEIMEFMGDNQPEGMRPLIFPMSNPTSNIECTAEAAQEATKGRAIFASGSPFADVVYQGKTLASSQSNNMYFFPGLALGAQLGHTKKVTDRMLMAAAETLPKQLSAEDLKRGAVYPQLQNIREISVNIAIEVMKVAHTDGHLYGKSKRSLEESEDTLRRCIIDTMFKPTYKALVYREPGVGE